MSELVLVTGVGPGAPAEPSWSVLPPRLYGGDDCGQRSDWKIATATPNTHGFVCDVADEAQLTATLDDIRNNLGLPKVVVHNAVGAERGTYLEIEPQNMRAAFEVNTMALLTLAKQLPRQCKQQCDGALIAAAMPSAYRGKARRGLRPLRRRSEYY